MSTFGQRLRECRKQKGLSQNELANILNTNHSVIGKYERDIVNPSIDAVKRLAQELDTSVAYLIGEAETNNLFKDPEMLKRLKDITSFSAEQKEHILFALDAMIKSVKLENL